MNLQLFLARAAEGDMLAIRILSVCRLQSLCAERAKILRKVGYQVESCADSAAAIEKLKTGAYDLVIVGHSASHPEDTLVAQTAHFSNIPVLMLANDASETVLAGTVGDHAPQSVESLLRLVALVLNCPTEPSRVI